MTRSTTISLLVVLAGLLCLACGSSSSSPTEPPPPAPRNCVFPEPPAGFPDRTATFTPNGAGGGPSITLQPSQNCPDLLVLQLVATGVTNLGGLQYQISAPSAALTFDNFRLGPFLNDDGAITLIGGGGLQGDLRRPPGEGGVDGSGQIALIAWVYTGANGTFSINLSGQALDPNGSIISGVVFTGGTVTISN